MLLCQNLLDSRQGRAIRSLRGGIAMVESLAIDFFRMRLAVFVLAGLLAGLSGWLYAHMQRFVSPTPFDIRPGIELLLMALVGGAGQIAGAVVGAAIVMLLKNVLQDVLPVDHALQRAARSGGLRRPVHRAAAEGARRHRADDPPLSAAPERSLVPVEAAPLAAPNAPAPISGRAGAADRERHQALRRAGGGQRRELRGAGPARSSA